MFIHLNLRALNPESPVPLHAQVENSLRKLMVQAVYRDGGLLPDELTLAKRLAVSRGTLRAAIGRLVQEGLLERKSGVGTRVCQRPAESGIGAWRSFSREMARKGIHVENLLQNFDLVAASEPVARALQIDARTKVWRLDRVRGWDGKPVLRTCSWFHPRLGLTGQENFTRPLYEVIEAATGVVAENAREEFAAVSASAELAKLLAVKRGTPLLLRSHTVSDAGGRPIEFAEVYYVSERFALTLDLRRSEKPE